MSPYSTEANVMMKVANCLNGWWNRSIFWFHDAATRTNIRWLVSLSIWMYDRMFWRLSDDWQLVCGMPLKEYKLRYDLELAQHQIRYYADYAYELQCLILFPEKEEQPRRRKKAKQPVTEAK